LIAIGQSFLLRFADVLPIAETYLGGNSFTAIALGCPMTS
jgi:hypothetical protein